MINASKKVPNCFLGLTATASIPAMKDILSHLSCSQENDNYAFDIPSNLNFSVIDCKNKNESLVKLIETQLNVVSDIDSFGSMIIYCNRRDTTESVASYLRTMLKWGSNSDSSGKIISPQVGEATKITDSLTLSTTVGEFNLDSLNSGLCNWEFNFT